MSEAAEDKGWLGVAEKGSAWGIATTVWLATVAGRPAARLLIRVVALWYTLLHPGVRRASRSWWQRLEGKNPSLLTIYRHVLRFAQVVLDRCFFVQGKFDLFTIERDGHQHLVDLHATGRGALLLSAHIGSTEAMAAGGYHDLLKIRVVGYFKNAAMINAALGKLDPKSATRVVSIEPGSADSVLAIRDRIEAGELLAVAGDRIGLSDRTVTAEFFGEPARFATGPFLLAAILKCPVYFVCGLYEEPNKYKLFCEPFAERIDLPRKDREAALQRYASQYAQRLEHYARQAPDNWFNFFDFWSQS